MLKHSNRHASYLFWGDLACFIVALYFALILRSFVLPDLHLLSLHIIPFAIIFLIWLLVFYIAGLYEFRAAVFQQRLVSRIINAQLINSGIAIIVFYFIPYFGITPRTVLFVDLVVTLAFVIGWRLLYLRKVSRGEREKAVILGDDETVNELKKVFAANPHFGVNVVEKIEPRVSVVILDLSKENLPPNLYPLLFSHVSFWNLESVYEDVFGRVALSQLSDKWVIENISLQPKIVYTVLKRLMDIVIALPLFVVSIIFYPFVMLAIKIENRGPVFVSQERVGGSGGLFKLEKFGSMTGDDAGNYSGGTTKLSVTKVGAFLRKSRIDELPQLISVLKGDQTLVGPRAELPALVSEYRKQIPYYDVRHTIRPGMSGWAQVNHDNHPHHGTAVEQTKEKLAYDLFYVKNRSLWLDLKIALRTVRTLLSRAGA
ncbi:MAG: hypothetical protein A3I39_02595 [Candidatus Yanofskybacteria bacterium RIFCSPLOWO2_02_FULL_47_9b]|uniref:Bacterial sugar transferase domain-containing protein n=1 Tax=Candidatus Yanofskybacteria bacterium RIFCSPLOWO2_02_FULL_47_9b TaxID=1802708 RepID=A0A1F8H7Y3_9BACT|nr:MAG: hypothetical protein A3I39_02595 [Candidatus Yanofskybacteria bacterium RIFCSPLOWO2_02_FULL_47_9b]